MIVKKKILSNEIIKKKNIKNIEKHDFHLFNKDLINNTGESYCYYLKNAIVINDGKILTFNRDIISDYLSFNSLSKLIFFKKILLYFFYLFKIILKKFILETNYFSKNVILVHNRNSIGYFHWLIDTLPKIIYLNKKFKNNILFLPNELKKKFVISSLKKFRIKFFFLKKKKNFKFKNLIYVGNLYPSGNPRMKVIKKLREKLTFKANNLNKIYVSRNKSERRKISNEKELLTVLKKYNFKTLYLDNMSFEKQIKIFSKAKYVVGLHGAGLSNIVWMKNKSHLIELRPEKDLYLNCYFNLSNLLNINYHYEICAKTNFFQSSKHSDYNVNIDRFKKKLNRILKNEIKKN